MQTQCELSTFFLLIFIRIALYKSLRQDIDQNWTIHPWTIESHTNINLALELWIWGWILRKQLSMPACFPASQWLSTHPVAYFLDCQPLTGSSTSFCTTQVCPGSTPGTSFACSTSLLVWPTLSQSISLNPECRPHCQLPRIGWFCVSTWPGNSIQLFN